MKKPLFSLICAVALLFSGCSKEETTAPKDEELYPVTFNVSTFSKEIVPMASLKSAGQVNASTTSGNALSDAINYIKYAVYNEAGLKITEIDYQSSDSEFGRIEDSLPKGDYTILIFGSKKLYASAPDEVDGLYYLDRSYGGDDILFKKINIEVKGTPVEQDLTLNRKVGKVEIELKDQIPANIEEIVYSIVGVSYYFKPLTNTASANDPIVKSNIYLASGSGTGQPDYTQDFGLYFFLNYDQDAIASVNIRAYDRSQRLVADKTINDVPVSVNKKTILTGRLFDEAGSTKGQAFSVSIDDKWRDQINRIEF